MINYESPFLQNALNVKKEYFPGLLISILIGFAALYISNNYGAPAMLMALLLGMAFNFLNNDPVYVKGLEFTAKTILRVGVAMLGFRITFSDVTTLGINAILMVCLSVGFTIVVSIFLAKKMGFNSHFGLLTGGSVAICGASAAMAISAVLPQTEETKRNTIFTVISVTTLSTVAMVVYPILTSILNLSLTETGMFLGSTIHDVAQVVGAGYSVSDDVGNLSTFIKLLRVAMLVPVVILASVFFIKNDSTGKGKVKLPLFLLGFVLIFAVNSTGYIPEYGISFLTELSSKFLLFAVAALGVRTSLKEVLSIGFKPICLVFIESVFIVILILFWIFFTR